MIVITPQNKKETRALRWLQTITYHDNAHQVLCCIHKNGPYAEACNGFALFRINQPKCMAEIESDLVYLNGGKAIPLSSQVIVAEPRDGKYADTDATYAKTKTVPIAITAVDPKLLIKALQMPCTGNVTIEIHEREQPIVIRPSTDEVEAVALVMPISPSKRESLTMNDVLTWIEYHHPKIVAEAVKAVLPPRRPPKETQ